LVLSAPALDANIDPVRRGLAKVLGRFAPRVELPNRLTGDQLSSDPAVGEAYFSDPLVYTKTTTGLGKEILRVMDDTKARMAELDVPTLVIHGSMDSVVSPAFSAPLGELDIVDRVLLTGFAHECFNDVDKDKALATVADWLDAHTSSAA
jgi:alpha-beta hydrolase superfamily lysophospholipase